MLSGVFQNSAVENVKLPKTLKRIEYKAFANCNNLKAIQLPKGLEYVGTLCFCNSGLEEIVFPQTVKTISASAFQSCKHLHQVKLNEGLEVLGGKWKDGENEYESMTFVDAGIESVKIPSTLKVIEAQTFYKCKSLKCVEFSEGLDKIGVAAFAESGIESIVLPSTTRTVCGSVFYKCEHLASVQLNEGLEKLGIEE